MNERILIVEDSATQAMRAKLILQDAGYSVKVAPNGKLGLEEALATPPDLIVADITMPVMDGYEMTRQLRCDPKTAHTPIFMLTANDQPLDVIRGLEVGADHFITKPYHDDFLVLRVKEFFAMIEHSQDGHRPQQMQVDEFSQKITLTPTREQILQALLQATAQIINCQAMALFLISPKKERLLFTISFAPLQQESIDQISEHLVTVLSRVRNEDQSEPPTHFIPVVVKETRFSSIIHGNLMSAFMNAPLIVDQQVIGIVGAYNTIPEVFDLQNVGFLFDLGQKAAEALSHLELN